MANCDKAKKASKAAYKSNPEKAKEASKAAYRSNPEKAKEASKAAYRSNPLKAKEASKTAYKTNPGELKKAFKKRYSQNKVEICKEKRDKYLLQPPKDCLIKQYVTNFANSFLSNPEIKLYLTMKFNQKLTSYAMKLSTSQKAKVACRIAAKKLMHEVLSLRKTNAGMLIKYVRNVNSQTISGKDDFGKASHSLASEPFYYDTGYRHLLDSSSLVVDHPNRCLDSIKPKLTENEFTFDKPIVMDETGRAHLSEVLLTSDNDMPKRWECSVACRQVSNDDVDTIVSINNLF